LHPIINKMAANMPGRNPQDFWGWVKSARAGRYKKYNRHELIKWFEEHEADLDGRR